MFIEKGLQTSVALAITLLSLSPAADARKSDTKTAQTIQLGPQSTYCRSVKKLIEQNCMPSFTWEKDVSIVIAVNANGDIVETGNIKSEEQQKALQAIKDLKRLPAPPEGSKNPYWLGVCTGNTGDEVFVSARDVKFSEYMVALQKKVKKNWRPPRGFLSNQVKLSFRLFNDGHIENLTVAQSDATENYDKAALDAASKAAPFNPLPDGSSESVKVEFNLAYNASSWGGPPIASAAAIAAQATNATAKKDYVGAIQILEQALTIEPGNELTTKHLSSAYNDLARSEMKTKPEAAMVHFKKAREVWPENPMAPGTLEEAHKMYDNASDDSGKH